MCIRDRDTSLQGVVATYEDCDAGTYQLSYSGSVTSVGVYYEPDVELSAFLTDEDGQPVDMDALYPGTYRLCYGLADKNGNLTNSKLLGETHYSVPVSYTHLRRGWAAQRCWPGQ